LSLSRELFRRRRDHLIACIRGADALPGLALFSVYYSQLGGRVTDATVLARFALYAPSDTIMMMMMMMMTTMMMHRYGKGSPSHDPIDEHMCMCVCVCVCVYKEAFVGMEEE
jgi:hypothetical protein